MLGMQSSHRSNRIRSNPIAAKGYVQCTWKLKQFANDKNYRHGSVCDSMSDFWMKCIHPSTL
ncbi:hypothetical protein PGTUg99_003012 [Puccinia graminis f. sp. tritici]|uniref:Uncharacterized protein n=1 Tax=Puccinia graminis f. sp. tritici TaxID=56615 RepID=A0A5B0MMA3_PUCGR|nr:hypothetical protein PGTUg99_003012 [Puccinia graminis f. sp. tritici]